MTKADIVIGCNKCGKPCALVGDDAEANVCPWCLAERSPAVFAMWRRETVADLIGSARERGELKP